MCLFKLILLLFLALAVVSCSVLPCGSPQQVQKWEKKTKFRSAKYIKNHNADSCQLVRMMAMGKLGG